MSAKSATACWKLTEAAGRVYLQRGSAAIFSSGAMPPRAILKRMRWLAVAANACEGEPNPTARASLIRERDEFKRQRDEVKECAAVLLNAIAASAKVRYGDWFRERKELRDAIAACKP